MKSANENTFFAKSVTKNYWCYNCQSVFSKIYIESQPIECTNCFNPVCEEIIPQITPDNPSAPQNFMPYSSQPYLEVTENIIRIDDPEIPLVEIVQNLIDLNYEHDEIEDILTYLINNDTNVYGVHPTSQKAINSFQKIKINNDVLAGFQNENVCSVCKDEFEVEQECLYLPCKHYFHVECINPWLKEHNSCPICRFELATDDEECEDNKKNREMEEVAESNENNVNK